jgi:pimeloyl-ACP methyl ester carboxylesterase
VSISPELGERRTASVEAGTIDYRIRGSGPPIVFVHGVGVNGDLWRKVVPALAGEHRCIAPDLPHGAHSRPLRPDADLSLPGLARIVAGFIEALELEDVTVVAYGWATKAPIDAAIMRRHLARNMRRLPSSYSARL